MSPHEAAQILQGLKHRLDVRLLTDAEKKAIDVAFLNLKARHDLPQLP